MSLVADLESAFNPMSSDEHSISVVSPEEIPPSETEGDPEDIASADTPVAEAAPTAPAPVDAPAKTEATPDRWAKQFEKYSQKDLELRNKEKELRAREAEIAEALSLRELAQKDKMAAFKKLGLSVDDVLKDHLNNGKADPDERIAALEAKIARLEGDTSETKKTSVETHNAYLEEIGNRWDNDFAALLEQGEYSFIKNIPGKREQIEKGVVRYFNDTKKLLPPKQALDIVVKELRENYDVLHKHLSPQATTAPTEPVAKTSGPKTLSPKMNAMPRYSYPSDAQEEFAELIAKHTRR